MPILPTSGDYNSSGYIGISNADGTFGVFPSILQEGGYQEHPTLEERNLIPIETTPTGATISPDGLSCGRRRVGMTIFVIAENAAYRLLPKGYFGNGGNGTIDQWNALSNEEKAVLLDPLADFEVGGFGGSTQYTGSGNADDCWEMIFPEDVDGTLPSGGSAGQVVVKDGTDPYEVAFTDMPAGGAGATSVFYRFHADDVYDFNSSTLTQTTIAELSMPGVRTALNQFGYFNSDIKAWKVNYKVVLDFDGDNVDPRDINFWISDEENSAKAHPSTWVSYGSTTNAPIQDTRGVTISSTGYIMADQGSGNTDITAGTNVKLGMRLEDALPAGEKVHVRSVILEITPMIDAEFGTFSADSENALAAITISDFVFLGDGADSAPGTAGGGSGTD